MSEANRNDSITEILVQNSFKNMSFRINFSWKTTNRSLQNEMNSHAMLFLPIHRL